MSTQNNNSPADHETDLQSDNLSATPIEAAKTDNDISAEEIELLDAAGLQESGDDDEQLTMAQLDETDEDGDLLNEETDLTGEDLDVPGAEEDDEQEEIGEEDEENNSYSTSSQDDDR